MSRLEHLTRDKIAGALVAALEPLPHVHAMWEGGSPAFQRVDEWSDIDLYVDADDDEVAAVLATAERALADLAPIERRYDPPLPAGAAYLQAFFRLRGASPFLLVDLAVLKHSSPEKFLVREVHGAAIFLFNKEDRVQVPPLDRAALTERIAQRCARLQARADIFWIFFDKFLARGHEIEAIDFYNRVILGSLVEALRMRYSPPHFDFGTYYASVDLPPAVVDRLRGLFFVRDVADLRAKRAAAAAWFAETLATVAAAPATDRPPR
jgi:hypothetical protein